MNLDLRCFGRLSSDSFCDFVMIAVVEILLRIFQLTLVTSLYFIFPLIFVASSTIYGAFFALLLNRLKPLPFFLCFSLFVLLHPIYESLVTQLLLQDVVFLGSHLSVLPKRRPSFVAKLKLHNFVTEQKGQVERNVKDNKKLAHVPH